MQRYALWFPTKQKEEKFGYGRVRRRFLSALAHAGFRVLEGGDAPDNVIQISHFQPFAMDEWRKRWERRPGVHKAILYTTFESTKLPLDYIAAAKDFDAVWTTSRWCEGIFKAEFESAGVDVPVHVVRHGVDSGSFPPMLRPFRGTKNEPFTFLWKGQNPGDRKNGETTFEAFKKAAIPNSRLLLKAQPAFTPRGTFFNVDGATFTSDWWTDDEQRQALLNADCFVQPTRAEGFGLEPLEALATCLPTMVTGYSGVTEYLWDGAAIWERNMDALASVLDPEKFSYQGGAPSALCYPLPFSLGNAYYNEEAARVQHEILGGKKVGKGWLDLEYDYGEDAQLSSDDIAEAMVYAVEKQEGMRILANLASNHVHANWTWHRAVRDAVHSFESLGMLEEVAWMHSDAWLTDIRNTRMSGAKYGPWARGVEPKSKDEMIDKSVVEL